jgi:hypothetical protein
VVLVLGWAKVGGFWQSVILEWQFNTAIFKAIDVLSTLRVLKLKGAYP